MTGVQTCALPICALVRAVRVSGKDAIQFSQDTEQLAQLISQQAQDGDVVMCMGAGSIGAVPARVVALQAKAPGGQA